MTVYVDELAEVTARKAPHIKRWCHMLADTDEELEAFARLLGLRRAWKHADHYDLATKQRARAVALGAREISSRQMVNVRRALRGQPPVESIPPIKCLCGGWAGPCPICG